MKNGTINNHLINNNSDKKIGDIYHNYKSSLAFWTVITHLLGIGDRHLDNIMMTNDGILFHIDYSYILGQDPKFSMGNVSIRMTKDLIEGLGGKMEKYTEFKDLCSKIFIALRRHSILFFSFLMQFNEFDPAINNGFFTNKYLEDQLAERFFIGQSDDEASKSLKLLIDQSCDNYLHSITDYFHYYGTKSPIIKSVTNNSMFGWFFGK